MADVTIKVAGSKWTLTSVLLKAYCSKSTLDMKVKLIKKMKPKILRRRQVLTH